MDGKKETDNFGLKIIEYVAASKKKQKHCFFENLVQ